MIELVQDHKGDTFRAVYTARFLEVIVVLHASQKKSKKGSATPKARHGFDSFKAQASRGIIQALEKEKRRHMSKKPDYEVTEGNIFEALGREQSEEVLARAKLLHQVSGLIKKSGLSRQEVAKKLKISQPKVSMLVSGKLSAFSADSLMHYLFLLGCEVEIRFKKPRSKVGIFRHKGCIAVC